MNQSRSQLPHNLLLFAQHKALINAQLWLLKFVKNASDIILHDNIFHFSEKNLFSNSLEHKHALKYHSLEGKPNNKTQC